jgi:hypothetical protein
MYQYYNIDSRAEIGEIAFRVFEYIRRVTNFKTPEGERSILFSNLISV